MSPCLWYMLLFLLQIISSIVKQQMTTVTTRLVNWRGSSTVCYRRSSRDPLCRLWSSGMNICCPITPSFLQILIGSFWPGHGFWQLSTRLGVHTWSGNSNVMPVDFWMSFTTSVLSTVGARSKIGQGLSCFCPAIVIGGDDHSPLHLLGLLLVGLLERGWVKGSEIEACRSEYQSFVQEQRLLERSSTRSRPDIGDVLSFCCSQAGFGARQHLFKVCVVTNVVRLRDRYVGKYWSCFLRFSSWQLSLCADQWLVVGGSSSVWIGWWFVRMRCKVRSFAYKTLWGVRISRSGASFQTQGLPC